MLTDEQREQGLKNLSKLSNDHGTVADTIFFDEFMEEYRTLQQQNKQLIEQLSEFGDNNRWTWATFSGDIIAEWNINQNGDPVKEVKKVLQSIQGGVSSDN